jgi:AbiTii
MSKSSEIISLIKSIETNCYTQGVKLPDILRQCKSLAHKLDYLPLKNWADYELAGYSDNTQLPPYRILKNVPLFADLLGNHYGGILTIKQHPLTLKQDFIESEDILRTVSFLQNVADLQAIVDLPDRQSFHFSLPATIYSCLESSTNASIIYAYKLVSVNSIVGILDNVKTRILDFTLELQDIPLGLEDDTSTSLNLKKEEVERIFQENILDNYNNGNNVSNQIHIYSLEALTMTQNPGGVSIGRDASGNLFNSENSGVVVGGDISGRINNAVNQLLASNSAEASQLAEALQKLVALIKNEPNLSSDDRELALEQVAVLADEGKNPQKDSQSKPFKTAIAALKGIVGALSPAAELAKEANKILPLITGLF